MQIATLEDGAVGFRGISTPRTGGCIEFAFIEVGEEISLNRVLMPSISFSFNPLNKAVVARN